MRGEMKVEIINETATGLAVTLKAALIENPKMTALKGFRVEAGVWSVKTSAGWLEIVRVK
jgi:hypothetical protein